MGSDPADGPNLERIYDELRREMFQGRADVLATSVIAFREVVPFVRYLGDSL